VYWADEAASAAPLCAAWLAHSLAASDDLIILLETCDLFLEVVTYPVSAALPLLSLLQPLLPLLLQPGLLLHLIILMATCHCILNRRSGACSHLPETTAARNVTAACSTFVMQQHISLTLTNPKCTTHLHS